MQEPSVLIRVPGKARDQLLTLRKKTSRYNWGGGEEVESLGAVVARLAEDASKKPATSRTVVNKTAARPRRKARR